MKLQVIVATQQQQTVPTNMHTHFKQLAADVHLSAESHWSQGTTSCDIGLAQASLCHTTCLSTASASTAGKYKPQPFMPSRMNGQYIIEGITGAMMYSLGGTLQAATLQAAV